MGKSVISVCKRTKKGLTDAFERGKKTFQFSDLLVLKDQVFNAVKRDAVFLNKWSKGHYIFAEGIRVGFSVYMVYKMVKSWAV